MVSCGAAVLAQTPVDSSFPQHYTMRSTSHARDSLGGTFLSELQTAGSVGKSLICVISQNPRLGQAGRDHRGSSDPISQF